MPLPNFIIIGAMKTGTTTLHSSINAHPQIAMSNYKELNYFGKNYHKKSQKWYSSQFPKTYPVAGEATPAYTWADKYPEVPERIFTSIPNAKLIYILRDPIDRIFSHLHHDMYRDRFKPQNLDEKVLGNSHYVTTSKYFYQFRQYLNYFKKENILLLEMSE